MFSSALRSCAAMPKLSTAVPRLMAAPVAAFQPVAMQLPTTSVAPSFAPSNSWSPAMPVRGFATEKQLRMRIAAVQNIQKITKAMQMVAAAKLRKVERLLAGARAFGAPFAKIWPTIEVEEPPKKRLFVVLSSDRGLCGAVNSSLVRLVKREADRDLENGRDISIVCVGDKARAGLERLYSKHMLKVISEMGKLRPATFNEICLVAEHILSEEYDEVSFVYNEFVSAISYNTTTTSFFGQKFSEEQFVKLGTFDKYETEGGRSEVLQDLYQYQLAVRLFSFIVDGATSEQSARAAAMDNASKNAGEMIGKLRLNYNRKRQSKITTELCEIISGAAAAAEVV